MAHIPMPGAAIPYRPPNNLDEGPNMKGGGLRGGPRRWTGKGPQPARHIPWPEIFKHHISLIEGHHKMLDMVRKHCMEGTGNYRMITDLLRRSNQILQDTKQVSRNFVPPKDAFDKVPLGAGSASMYPGYSPADHEYGKAAMEYGKAVADARAIGVDFKPGMDIDYEIGQARGVKRKTLEGLRTARDARDAAEHEAMGTGDNAVPITNGKSKRRGVPEGSARKANDIAADEQSGGANTHQKPQDDDVVFSLDANPTPSNLAKTNGISHQEAPSSDEASADKVTEEPTKEEKSKKRKVEHDGSIPDPPQFEDISAEVDARLKEKEEKRKAREEKKAQKKPDKKRKRESEGSVIENGNVEGEAAPLGGETMEKPKKKKPKKSKNQDTEMVEAVMEKRKKKAREGGAEQGVEDKKAAKRRKKEKVKDNII